MIPLIMIVTVPPAGMSILTISIVLSSLVTVPLVVATVKLVPSGGNTEVGISSVNTKLLMATSSVLVIVITKLIVSPGKYNWSGFSTRI